MVDMPIDYATGTPANAPRNNDFGIFSFGGNTAAASNGGFVEHFRRGADGQPTDTQYQIVSRDDAYNAQTNAYYYGGQQGDDSRWTAGRAYYPNQGWSPAPPRPAPPQPVARGLFQPWPNSFGAQQQAPRQDYFWGGRYN